MAKKRKRYKGFQVSAIHELNLYKRFITKLVEQAVAIALSKASKKHKAKKSKPTSKKKLAGKKRSVVKKQG
jgi:hypothetical protein